jgi:hypothetical protein
MNLNGQAFDAFTRQTAARVSRRGSLQALAAVGLAAALVGPLATEAKNGNQNQNGNKKQKKTKRKIEQAQNQQCAPQRDDCIAIIAAGGTATLLPCCESLAVCDFNGFIVCLVNGQNAQA